MISTWGIIGVGQLGASVAKGIHRSQAPLKLCLSPRSELRVQELAATVPVTVAENNQAVVDSADHVLLAARPKQIVEIAPDLRFRPGQVVVSLAAALPHGRIQQAVRPATAVRAMPVL